MTKFQNDRVFRTGYAFHDARNPRDVRFSPQSRAVDDTYKRLSATCLNVVLFADLETSLANLKFMIILFSGSNRSCSEVTEVFVAWGEEIIIIIIKQNPIIIRPHYDCDPIKSGRTYSGVNQQISNQTFSLPKKIISPIMKNFLYFRIKPAVEK